MRYRGTPRRTADGVLRLCGVLMALLAAASSWAGAEDWNQQQVTQLAAEFYDAAQHLREECRRAPSPRRTSELVNDHDRLLYDVRRIRSRGAFLYTGLQAGKGAAETRPLYEQLIVLMVRARRDVVAIRPARPVTEALGAAESTLRRLAPYYAEG